MEEKEIIQHIKSGILLLLKNDSYLLINDVSERSITHKLAEYLQYLFPEYNVDCEYNRNMDEPKSIMALKSKLLDKNLLREKEMTDLEKELTERAVFPDIIIHTRGTNANNLCILEVKKDSSPISQDYDKIKLEAYTTAKDANLLNYKIGILLTFKKDLQYKIATYKNGKEITR